MSVSALVDQLVRDLRPYGPQKITLFGSAARGDFDESSDIDLRRCRTNPMRRATLGWPAAMHVIS